MTKIITKTTMRSLKIIIALLLLMNVGFVEGQNLFYYATHPNGKTGERLFPEDSNGDVFFSDIIEIPYSADTIMAVIDEFLLSKDELDRFEVDRVSKSPRKSSYKVQLNIGRGSWGIEVMGTPIFGFTRDASQIKFNCLIEYRNGKYKYTLNNFETNRRTIRGNAKNDGQPNIIHWHRVNSLKNERDSYIANNGKDNRKAKEFIYDCNTQIAYEECLYIAEYEATKAFVESLKNINFSDDFSDESFSKSTAEVSLENMPQGRNTSFSSLGDGFYTMSGTGKPIYVAQTDIKDVDWSTFKGNLMDKGNNVYIRPNIYDRAFERAGVEELIKQVTVDGFWNVVNDKRKAHFIIVYYVNLDGRDTAGIFIQDVTGSKHIDHLSGSQKYASESINENRDKAKSIYLDAIYPLLKKIEEKKYPKNIRVFNVE